MTLVLQEKWQKQLAKKDFLHYQKLYSLFERGELTLPQSFKLTASIGQLIPLRQAKNHRGERLIICFYHNNTADELHPLFNVHLRANGDDLTQTVSIPNITLKPRQTTLWTVIFNDKSQPFKDGWLINTSAIVD